jgi:CheY-like chemotaxis protein
LSDRPQDQQNRVLVDNVDESLGAVEDLLDALLDISKLDAGAVSPEISDFDVSALLAPLTTEYTVLARERELELRSVSSNCILRSDVKLLRRIIQNFLSNAIRYTGAGKVLLGARRTAAGLRIEVWDTGPGIPAEKLDEIFEEFRQLHNARSGRDRGIGLGLAIVKRIAKMLGTSIGVRSVPGRGSVFSVTVPFGQAPVALARGAARQAPDLGLSQSVVLVIDNEQSILTGMNALLSGWNCRVYSATSGDEALQVLPGLPAPPDIVIADYHLDDGVSGVTELQRISRACGRVLPGIIITANRTQEAQDIAKRHGYRLLNKPVKPAQLRSLMIQLIG